MIWMQKYIFNIFLLIAFLTLSSIYISNEFLYEKKQKASKRIFILKEKINRINIELNTQNDYIKTALDIESYIKKQNLIILNTKISKSKIIYTLSSDLKSLLKFINYCELTYEKLSIKTFSLNNSNTLKEKTLKITLNLNKNLFNKKFDKKSFSKKLIKLNESEEISKNSKDKLFAIIGNNVLINTKWLRLNDSYNGYKIVNVTRSYVELNNGFYMKRIKLHKDE